jgi:hypothetical protein
MAFADEVARAACRALARLRGSGMPVAAGDHPGTLPDAVRAFNWKTGSCRSGGKPALTEACGAQLW